MTSQLAHTPADVIAQLLVDGGQGSDPLVLPLGDWPIYVESEPDSPDSVLTVYTTTGIDDGRTMPDGELQQHYGFQVRIRSRTAKEGYTKAAAIRAFLSEVVKDNRVSLDLSDYLVLCVSKIGQIMRLGKDTPTTKRSLYTLNATLPLRQLS